jgi:hypothetical protein
MTGHRWPSLTDTVADTKSGDTCDALSPARWTLGREPTRPLVIGWPGTRCLRGRVWSFPLGNEDARWSGGAGVAVGVDHFDGGVGEEFGVPAGLVEQVVVAGAREGQVGGVVGPPWSQRRTWWPSHQGAGRSQPGNRQCRSRMTSAFHSGAGMVRVAVP